jgi:type II secretory pathway component PulF
MQKSLSFFRNASIITLVLIVSMRAFSYVMHLRMEYYVDAGLNIPLVERILFGISALWNSFWWVLIFVFAGIGLASAGIIELLQRRRLRSIV